LHARHPHEISRIRIGGQGAVRLNLPGGQGCFQPRGRCRRSQLARVPAANPDSADLVRVARVQALIASTTSIVTEAAATTGHIDPDLLQRLAPTLEANQVAWSHLAKRWGELTSPASRTNPALVAAASEVRAAIAATATTQNGWATPDQLASRVDLVNTVKTLHLSMIASVDIAHVALDTAADHPGLPLPRASSA
jgi:hypothetical protein